MTGSVSHPNGGRDFCNFLTLRVISACCSGQDEIELARGVLNWSVALSGASMREKPLDEKSVQVNVVRFAARDCNRAWLTRVAEQSRNVTYCPRALREVKLEFLLTRFRACEAHCFKFAPLEIC